MSEDLTQNLPNNDLKLILVRLDSIDTRLGSIDTRLDSVDTRLDALDRRFDAIDARLNSMDERLDVMDARLNSMDTRLATLEDKVERRLLETRPIWERVLEQLKEVNLRLMETNTRLTGVENETKNFRRMLRASLVDLIRVQEDFEERLEKLEGPNAPR